jgi:hypothetical protein
MATAFTHAPIIANICSDANCINRKSQGQNQLRLSATLL